MEGIFFILIFIGVIAITALLFCVWIIVMIARLGARMVGAMFAPPRAPAMPFVRAVPAVRCGNSRCNAMNPAGARFCRRCGHAVATQRVAARRVACW